MRARSILVSGAAAALLLLGSLALPAAGETPQPATLPGDSWDVTSQMSMEAMPMAMPEQTQRVCSPKNWTEPPPGGSRDCRASDFKTSGNKSTWSVQCSGPPAMTGHGEITRTSPDAYTGSIRFESPEGGMTVKLSGKRVGECRVAQ